MKIGIFGDSYASIRNTNPTPSWIDILNQRENTFVVSHGQNGSNFYYSVDQFKTHYKQYDLNIMLVTNPGRIWARYSNILKMPENFFNSLETIEEQIQFQKEHAGLARREKIVTTLETAKNYLLYIQDAEYECYLQELMIQDVLSMDKNLILIPCYNNNSALKTAGSLFDVFLKENDAWNYKIHVDNGIDIRNCHMTAENNKIFAGKIIAYIEQGKEIDLNINDFMSPSSGSKDFYIKEQQ
jgi:vacuolar-type H+-ATPase subunit E/Vma4